MRLSHRREVRGGALGSVSLIRSQYRFLESLPRCPRASLKTWPRLRCNLRYGSKRKRIVRLGLEGLTKTAKSLFGIEGLIQDRHRSARISLTLVRCALTSIERCQSRPRYPRGSKATSLPLGETHARRAAVRADRIISQPYSIALIGDCLCLPTGLDRRAVIRPAEDRRFLASKMRAPFDFLNAMARLPSGDAPPHHPCPSTASASYTR